MGYLYRRLGFYLVALWASVTLNFLLPRLMPGSPIDYFLGRYREQLKSNPHLLDSLRAMLGGSSGSLPAQYLQYLGNLLHGDFGVSYSEFPTPVSAILGNTLPWTLFLAGSATILAFLIGTVLGIVTAWRRSGLLDNICTPLSMFTSAFPPFFAAMLLLYVFGFVAGWFPLQHSYGENVQAGPNLAFVANVLWHAALPIASFLLLSVGGWLLGMRNVMLSTLSEDYVTLARAKGLSNRRIMFAYAARNALLPQVTGFAIALGFLVSGVVLIEYVFSYPGVGYTLINAVQAEDYPLMQALFLLITVAVLGSNLAADLLYVRLDPRVRNT